ncbi:WXG100 family type VII secretion target [Krasilnikoviella flava]|uniref:WXG100 family type VII secretion target n=1 Tax=Krasilnikoviella flava TaxID=526729 RepID=A0A1T5J8Y1_9MICO|nr:hypothetical protein [Krasilnikoviella flava]SKC47718.1 hypothetical protein SAMN04324258_1134 [Krasilnikoviella flava]
MGEGMYGADIEALRLLADKIAEGGTTLEAAITAVETAMPGPEGWDGPDAEGFRSEWGDTHVTRLRDTANLLSDVATKVRDNADEQDTTSNDYTGFAGVTTTGTGTAGGGGGGGGGGGVDGSEEEGGENPLPNVGSDPTAEPTDPNDPNHTWTDGYNDHRGPQSRYESSGTYDENGNYTPSAEGESAVNRPAEKGDINHTLVEGETGGFVGAEAGVDGKFGDEDGFHGSGEAGASAGAGYDAAGEVSVSENGLVAEGSAGVNAGAGASASGQVGYGDHVSAEGSAEAFVGGRAEVTGGASIGPDGVGVSAGFDAFAGGEASAAASGTVAGVTAGAEGTVYAGVGITANADVNLGFDSVGVDLELGAALGIGAGFDVSLEWSPADTVDAITDVGGDVWDGVTGGWW